MLKLTPLFALFAAFLLFGTNAQALTITPTASTGDSASFDDGDSGGTQSATHGSPVTIVDEVAGTTSVNGQYKYHVWVDTYGGNHDITYTHELTTVFDVLADAAVSYEIVISTSRLGSFGVADDTTWYSAVGASAHLSALTGTINGGSNEAGLDLLGLDLNVGHGQTYDETVAVNQASTGTTVTGNGNSTWTVVTTWTSRGHSYYDEAGLSFGDAVDLGYLDISPGANDGVGTQAALTITAVPEPSTALLVGLGLAGLASVRRQSKR